MADKSFGVKELNLLNASGTPTVTSPNNLNLNANTVAISTSATVGNNLTVSGQINVGSNIKIGNAGVVTATSFVGSGSGLTGVASTDPSNVQATWKLGGGSGSGFTFTGPGQDGSEGNPDIYLVRGQRYLFDNTVLAGNHPFEFRNAANTADYTDGVSGAQNGLQYLNVQHDAPARLKYRCTIHTNSMLGDIYIIGGPEVISGVVTATTFVGNLTGNVTGTASANAVLTGSTNNQLVTVTGANAITGESGLTFSSDRLILTNTSTPQIRINNDTSDGSSTRFVFGKATANNNFINGAVAGDSCIGFPSDLLFGVGASEKLRINSSGEIISTNGTLRRNVDNSSFTLSGGTASNSGSNIAVYGNNHSSLANVVRFRTGSTERLRIGSSGQIGIAGANYGTSGQVLTSQGSGSAVQWASPVVAGSILQTVYGTTTNEIVVTSTSFQNFTALNTSITRMSSNSHLWVWINAVRLLVQADSNEARVRITDGTSATTPYRLVNYDSDGNYLSFNPCLNWYWTKSHTAGTTVTITPQIRTINGNNVVWGDNGDTSMMIIQEIAR